MSSKRFETLGGGPVSLCTAILPERQFPDRVLDLPRMGDPETLDLIAAEMEHRNNMALSLLPWQVTSDGIGPTSIASKMVRAARGLRLPIRHRVRPYRP